jgi:hypothetical protein
MLIREAERRAQSLKTLGPLLVVSGVKAQGANPLPLPLSTAEAGRNHVNE